MTTADQEGQRRYRGLYFHKKEIDYPKSRIRGEKVPNPCMPLFQLSLGNGKVSNCMDSKWIIVITFGVTWLVSTMHINRENYPILQAFHHIRDNNFATKEIHAIKLL